MERTSQKLLSEYKDADFNKRLDLYLQCRELRSEFTDIEKNMLHHESPAREETTQNFLKIRPGRLLSMAGWRIRRALSIA